MIEELLARVGKSRLILGMGAIVVLALVTAAGLTPAAPAPSEAKQAPALTAVEGEDPTRSYTLRDYRELAAGQEADSSLDWTGTLWGLVAKLILVVMLAYGTIWTLRRYVFRATAPASRGAIVSLLGSLDLSPGRTIYVLEVGTKVVVVGATASQMSPLTEITDPDVLSQLRCDSTLQAADPPFHSLLEGAESRLQGGAAGAELASRLRDGREFLEAKLSSIHRSANPR